MPKAYSYLRFSRPEQSKGDSFRRQYELAKKYADEHGLDLDESLTFHDHGVSAYQGKHLETGRLGDFLNEVKEGRVEKGSFLLVESLDRISRQSARKAQRILEDICDEGVVVVTLIDGRKYDQAALESDPLALIMSLLTFLRAHEESATKATRLKAAWSNKRLKIGEKPLTARAPFWLRLNENRTTFEVIEDRADLIRQMFSLYLSGVGTSGISKKFNREGVPAWGRKGYWFESYVTKILNNPAVYGVGTPHRLEHENGKKKRVPLEPVVGYFPAVIDEETFLLAQEVKTSRGIKGRKTTVPMRNVFSRMSRCPVCGSSMIFVNKGQTWQYLACSAAKNGVGICKYRAIPYDRLEASFLDMIRAGLDIPVDGAKVALIEKALEEREATMSRAIQRRSNLLEVIMSGTFKEDTIMMGGNVTVPVISGVTNEGAVYSEKSTPYTLRDEIALLDQTVEENRKAIVKLRGQLNLLRPAAVEARLKELETAAGESVLSRERVNAALRAICHKAVVQYDHGVIDLHFKHTETVLSIPVKMRADA